MSQSEYAERNVKLFPIGKIFTKRVFVPLLAVYFVQVAGFTLKDIGILAAFYAFVSFIAQIPTGYFADRTKKVVSIRIGAGLLTLSALFYVLLPTKTGMFSAQFVEAIGYAFVAGAREAHLHDSLAFLGKIAGFVKIQSRAQSFALLINAILVALIPLTYVIDKRIPFLIGALVFAIFFVFSFFLTEMPRTKNVEKMDLSAGRNWLLDNKSLFFWLFSLGVVGAVYWAPTDFTNLTLKEFGLRPELLGFVFSISSVLGVFIGFVFHKLRGLKPYQYAFLDVTIMALPLLSVIFHSMPILAITTIINLAFWRYRSIIYQEHVLNKYQPSYKATIISALSNTEQASLIWVPLLVAFLTTQYGLAGGLLALGVLSLGLLPLFVSQTRKLFG